MAGSQVEKDAILEKGKKFIYATSSATVPKQTVIVRKAYGAGIYAMGGPAYDPESVIALPSGEIGIMGPEAAINAVYANKLADVDDPEERARMEARTPRSLSRGYRHSSNGQRSCRRRHRSAQRPQNGTDDLVSFDESVETDLPDLIHGLSHAPV